MSVENRLQQFIEVHSKPIRLGLAAIGGWVYTACTPPQPQDISYEQPITTTPSANAEIQSSPPPIQRIELRDADEIQRGDILNTARKFINEGYFANSSVTFDEGYVAFIPAQRQVYAILQFERGDIIQSFLVENRYSLDSNSLEKSWIFVTNAFAPKINFLPEGTLTNNAFDRNEDNLKSLAERIFYVPQDFQWEDTSWFQTYPGIQFTEFTGITDLGNRHYRLRVSVEDSEAIPDLSRQHPLIELFVTYS